MQYWLQLFADRGNYAMVKHIYKIMLCFLFVKILASNIEYQNTLESLEAPKSDQSIDSMVCMVLNILSYTLKERKNKAFAHLNKYVV